ncbi:P-loop containing nucleoside triphosphate hydrolase [Pseudocohnilembus persalinus]|uniref:p-loop containing nucleoside triphosphate hydrolase n=1 Tax=Pseudocohnilembus persalinus TaxID=266149 RepID=A0A0V0QLV6_PSEPJ|nr:P-loop containing nucleoside triphosphate hydrolase [Pseudocohnilembus persalinus]|eukprot:KRX02949.1 P-loop containing nucleoside triphosphate hydrolase [Pseudocohnilembus persalinus]
MNNIYEQDDVFDIHQRIVIVGGKKVGKTNLIQQLKDGLFSDFYLPSSMSDLSMWKNKQGKQRFSVQFWDISEYSNSQNKKMRQSSDKSSPYFQKENHYQQCQIKEKNLIYQFQEAENKNFDKNKANHNESLNDFSKNKQQNQNLKPDIPKNQQHFLQQQQQLQQKQQLQKNKQNKNSQNDEQNIQDKNLLKELLEASESHNKKLKDLVDLLKTNIQNEKQKNKQLTEELKNSLQLLLFKDSQIEEFQKQVQILGAQNQEKDDILIKQEKLIENQKKDQIIMNEKMTFLNQQIEFLQKKNQENQDLSQNIQFKNDNILNKNNVQIQNQIQNEEMTARDIEENINVNENIKKMGLNKNDSNINCENKNFENKNQENKGKDKIQSSYNSNYNINKNSKTHNQNINTTTCESHFSQHQKNSFTSNGYNSKQNCRESQQIQQQNTDLNQTQVQNNNNIQKNCQNQKQVNKICKNQNNFLSNGSSNFRSQSSNQEIKLEPPAKNIVSYTPCNTKLNHKQLNSNSVTPRNKIFDQQKNNLNKQGNIKTFRSITPKIESTWDQKNLPNQNNNLQQVNQTSQKQNYFLNQKKMAEFIKKTDQDPIQLNLNFKSNNQNNNININSEKNYQEKNINQGNFQVSHQNSPQNSKQQKQNIENFLKNNHFSQNIKVFKMKNSRCNFTQIQQLSNNQDQSVLENINDTQELDEKIQSETGKNISKIQKSFKVHNNQTDSIDKSSVQSSKLLQNQLKSKQSSHSEQNQNDQLNFIQVNNNKNQNQNNNNNIQSKYSAFQSTQEEIIHSFEPNLEQKTRILDQAKKTHDCSNINNFNNFGKNELKQSQQQLSIKLSQNLNSTNKSKNENATTNKNNVRSSKENFNFKNYLQNFQHYQQQGSRKNSNSALKEKDNNFIQRFEKNTVDSQAKSPHEKRKNSQQIGVNNQTAKYSELSPNFGFVANTIQTTTGDQLMDTLGADKNKIEHYNFNKLAQQHYLSNNNESIVQMYQDKNNQNKKENTKISSYYQNYCINIQKNEQNQNLQKQKEKENKLTQNSLNSSYQSEMEEQFFTPQIFEEFFIFGAENQALKKFHEKRGQITTSNHSEFLSPQIIYQYQNKGNSNYKSQQDIIENFIFPHGVEAKFLNMTNSFSQLNQILYANYTIEPQNSDSNCFVLAFRVEDYKYADRKKSVNNFIDKMNPSRTLYAICYKFQDFTEISGENQSQNNNFQFEGNKGGFIQNQKVLCFLTYFPFIEFFLKIMTQILKQIKMERIQIFNEEISQFSVNSLRQEQEQLNESFFDQQQLNKKFSVLQSIDSDFITQRIREMMKSVFSDLIDQQENQNNFQFFNLEGNDISQFNLEQIDFQLKFKIFDENIYQQLELKNNLFLQEIQWGLEMALTQFSIDQFVFIVLALLMEKSVIFVSENITLLTNTLLLFNQQLFQPLNWILPVIFSMPESMVQLCDSPVSILAGLNKDKKYIQQQELNQTYQDCIFVYLGPDFEIFNKENIMTDLSIEFFQKIKQTIKPFFQIINPEDKLKQSNKNLISLGRQLVLRNPKISPEQIKNACEKVVIGINDFINSQIIQLVPNQAALTLSQHSSNSEKTSKKQVQSQNFDKSVFQQSIINDNKKEQLKSENLGKVGETDEIGAAIFIPNQPRAIIVTTTRYPEYGFFLGLYDLDSCSMIAPNGSCQPDLLAGYYERELNVRPDPKPQVIWYGGVDNKFVLSGYIRKEAATCMIKQYTVGVNYDEITDNGNTIYCTGENPAGNLYPEKQIYYTEALDMLYIKDYDIVTSMWVIRTYDLANNAFNANTHTWADEKYFLTNDQRTGVANKYYAYYEYDSTTGGAQTIFIKDIDQVKTNNYFTVTLVVDHVQEAVMFKTPSQLMAVIHNNYAIVLYNYQIDQPVHYIYFEVYFPLLESFKSVYGPSGDEMLQVASKVGEDRFIKWIIVDTTDNNEEDLVMWRGHTMKLNDPYDYNFQQAVAYDANQNYLSHMSSEQVYSFYYVDDCQHGYQTGYAGQCSDANCAIGCLSCDASTCIICQDGYTFDSTYTCQPSASYGQTADEDYVGVYIGFDGPGEYIQDTSTLEDLLVSFDYTNLRMYAFDIETEVLTITDLTAFIAFDVMDFVFLPTNQQLLCVEDEGASGYNMVRRTFATLGTTNPINIYRTDLPINIVAATLLDGATNYQHIIYMLDDGSTQDFYILDVDTGNQNQYSIGFNNLDTTNTVQIFFFAQLSWGNILLVQDLNFFTHVFECYANKPGGPPTCDPEAYSFDALAQVRYVHIDNTDNFVVYSVGDINIRVVQIGTGARTTLCNFAAPFGVTSGIYMLLTTTVSYDIFVTLNYDGTVSVFEFNAAFTTATLVRTIYGFKYWNRDLTAGSNYVGDSNVFLGWQSDAEQMKLGIKTYENYQTINLCGENGIHNDATANKCDFCHNYCLRCTVAADNTACDVCSVGYYKYFSATTCNTACPIVGEYADANWRECRPCNFQCQTCTASADNCLTCRAGNRLTPPDCACPANTYEDYTSANCPECDNINTPPSCVTCVEDYDGTGLCTVCAANMVNNDNDNLCECDVGDYTHPLAFTQYCTIF